ncbi:MAG: hypothetical protein GX621_03470 [Pirellulaceae bacterium]|nr:hypothetical protein [Pirellulaceae bacterium]
MKTTTRILWGLVAAATAISAASASAGSLHFALTTDLTTWVVAQTPSGPTSSEDARRQSDDLLARAKQAIDEGRFDVAEQLIQRAESLRVPYNPMNPLVKTPAKLRDELQRKQAGGTNGGQGLLAGLPFGNSSRNSNLPADPFARLPGNSEPGPLGDTPPRHGDGASGVGFANIQSAPPRPERQEAGNLLHRARRALAMGDVRRATEMAQEAKSQGIAHDPRGDNPDQVFADIQRYNDLVALQETQKQTGAYRRQYAQLMMQQADALLKWRDYEEAERLTMQAIDQRVEWGPLEANPNVLLKRIGDARRQERAALTGNASPAGPIATQLPPPSMAAKAKVSQLVGLARSALAAGDLAAAETYAQSAMNLQVPESSFGPDEDRPGLVLFDVQKARREGGVVQAGATTVTSATGAASPAPMASRAVYDGANDPTKNVPASQYDGLPNHAPRPLYVGQAHPTPAPPVPGETSPGSTAGESAAALFQKGEAALRAHNVDEALNYYRQAAQYRDQLDPETAGQLQARLQALSAPAPAPGPSGSPADEAMVKQQLLARTINSDVANQERRAMQLREADPKRALALLGQARMTVEKSGLDESAKAAMLRRVDRNIAETTQYIEDNRFQIELTERNDQTREQIDREQQHTLDTQQQLKQLVDRVNQLNEEQRFHEAEVVAKQAYEIAPNEQIAQQLLLNQKFLRRIMENRRIANEKEEGYIAAMLDVDRASTPFDTSKSIVFPDAREWRDLSTSRGRFRSDTRRERTGRELEIEQRLRTPISLRFTDAPLSLVLDQLQELAQISIHIDPQGLQEEGVASSTPVTINLRDEVSLKSALNLILQPLHLGYVIEDEVLKVTSEQYKNKEVYTVVYDVGDLVIPIPNFVPNSRMGLAGAYNDAMGRAGFNNTTILGSSPPVGLVADASAGGMTNPAVLAQMAQPGARRPGSMAGGGPAMGGFGPGGLGGGSQAEFEPLIDLITSTVKYNTWQEYGGEGLIDSYENNLTLVITNTEEVHAEVVNLLEQLRRLQDLQVTIEVRFITLNDDFFESIRVDFDFNVDDRIDPVRRNLDAANAGDDDDDDDDDDDAPPQSGKRQIRDAANGRSVTVGLTAPGVFAADLDIPFTQGSYDLAVPQFGGFDASAGASLGFAVLSNIEAFFFINAAQGDSRTNILQAPKVTLFNGQTAYVNDTSQSPFVMGLIPVVGDFAAAQQPVIVILSEGTFMTVQAVVSHDRRFVRLTVIPFFSQIGKVNTFTFQGSTSSTVDTSTEGNTKVPDDSTKENNVLTTQTQGTTVQLPTYSSISVSTTVSVPDGGTVLLGGIKRLSEGRSEYGTPILNKIPYINRLFRNVGIGRETQSLMMTVTPRIIIQEEEEERIGAGPLRP